MTTTPESDELLAVIRQYVHGRVHPSYEETAVEIIARVLVTMMSEPRFYNHLRVVIDLQRRVAQLEMAIRRYQQKAPRPPSSAPRPRKKLSKKAPAPTIKKTTKKPPLPHNVRAFKKGAQGQ